MKKFLTVPLLALLFVVASSASAADRTERPSRDRDVPPVVVPPPPAPTPTPAPVPKCSWTVSPDLGYGVKIPKNTPTTFSWSALPGATTYVVTDVNNVVVGTTQTGSITIPASGYMFFQIVATYPRSPWSAVCNISRSSQY